MKLINNMVAIKPFPSDEIRLSSGDKLYLDIRFEEYLNAQTAGEVVGIPDRLVYNTDPLSYVSTEWDTEMELQVGDVVVFNYLAVRNSIGAGYWIDKDTVCIPYDKIYVALRQGEVKCINGCIIVEPEYENIQTDFIIPDNAKAKSKQIGKVVYAGKPNKGYRKEQILIGSTAPDTPVEVGSRVVFNWNDAIPIQPNAELRGEITRSMLYRMQHKDVHALIPEDSLVYE